jgi:ATP-dependent DNA helicase RecG
MIKTNRLEWKREYSEDIKKELVAFANSQGGELIIGIANDGSIFGVDHPDQVAVQVTNMIRDAISPDLSLISRVSIDHQDGKALVHIQVNRGSKRPYYISKMGMTSSGVYLRQGNTSAPASPDAIRDMIRETDGYSYETMPAFDQNLTFHYCNQVFKDKGIRFGDLQKQSMKLIHADGFFTNLGMLLSDQCFHSIQFACFQGVEIGPFIDRQRFSGSILKQLDESFKAISRYNRTRSEIHGLNRTDAREYPEEVLREALINAIVHRDYDRDVSTNIRVFDNRIEIASYGGLPPNTTIETFLLGLSIPRNRNLADVFYRLELVEAFGSGIPKMTEIYQVKGKQIVFKTSPSGFLVILPSLFEPPVLLLKEKEAEYLTGHQAIQYDALDVILQNQYDTARSLIYEKGPVTRSELEVIWATSRSSATNIINKLLQKDLLISIGKGRSLHYALPRAKS